VVDHSGAQQGVWRRPFLRESLRHSAQHQAELALARAYQIPRSKLLGRQPRSVTTYEYDEQSGRLVRAITVHESEWLQEDRDWAEADRQEQLGRCPGCGLPLEETLAPENEGAYVAIDPPKCHACAPLNERKAKDPDPSLIHQVRKVR
jgi:hypothetical protein